MPTRDENSKVTLYIALGAGIATVSATLLFGSLLLLGFGGALIPTPNDSVGISPAPIVEEIEIPEITTPGECESLYTKIDEGLTKANYCDKGADCDSIVLGGSYVEFGCYHYINKNIDKKLFLDQMETYVDSGCRKIINKCAPVPEARCVENKCISKEEVASSETTKTTGVVAFVGAGNGIGENFTIESNFLSAEHTFKIYLRDREGSLVLEYDKQMLGEACSANSGIGKIKVPFDEKVCLVSTTCDAGEFVCFENIEIKNGLKLQYSVELYDGENI